MNKKIKNEKRKLKKEIAMKKNGQEKDKIKDKKYV